MTKVPRCYAFELDADFHQFYIEDEEADVTPEDVGDAWTPETAADMLAPGHGFVRFGTVRPMTVPIEVRVEGDEPPLDLDAFDHVAEASVEVRRCRIFGRRNPVRSSGALSGIGV